MEETSGERQQLVGGGGDEEEAGPLSLSLSPAASHALSSSGASKTQHAHQKAHPRVAYVSEKRPMRPPRHQNAVPMPMPACGMGMKGGDARKTQAALLRLLANFRAMPASSDALGTLAHMEDIREQQDNLARLHFKLGSDPDAPAKPASARETMASLVKSLEHLSTSIEQLHLTTEFYTNASDSIDESDIQSK